MVGAGREVVVDRADVGALEGAALRRGALVEERARVGGGAGAPELEVHHEAFL